MKLSFHGAARTVTGSKHLIHIHPGKKILLDCGMFQGMGKETIVRNSSWGFEPKEVDFVILSHAHIDHSGLLPLLVKDGFRGNIYCTPPTKTLARLLLTDSARIQENDAKFINKEREKAGRPKVEPLYSEKDAERVFELFQPIPFGEETEIDPAVHLLFTRAGHIPGAAAVNLRIKENDRSTRICFSGDIGRFGHPILKRPEPFPQADFIIMESTYGDRLHDLGASATEKLLARIEETCLQRKGKLIIPAFSLGRTQEILFMLNGLALERRLPEVPVYVDSPLSIKITEAFTHFTGEFNKHVQDLLKIDSNVFSFPNLHFITEVEDSIELNYRKEPCVILSSSGMAEAGRVKHHIAQNIADPKNTILLTGYCEPESLGGRLKEKPEEVGIFGKRFPVRAAVDEIDSLSAHGDFQELSQWLACQDPQQVKRLFLVHGSYDEQFQFQERLSKKGFSDIVIPSLHQEVGLGNL